MEDRLISEMKKQLIILQTENDLLYGIGRWDIQYLTKRQRDVWGARLKHGEPRVLKVKQYIRNPAG